MATSFLPMLPQPRPVDANWKCRQSGDCCTIPAEVVMTDDERITLMRVIPDGIESRWRDLGLGMWALQAKPCPFFLFNSCTVYAHRPYSCRRFACMRPDPKTEPFEESRGPQSLTGCLNADVRFRTSRTARRMMIHIQAKAMRWALKHGWTEAQ